MLHGRRRFVALVGALVLVGGVASAATFSGGSAGTLAMNAGDTAHVTCAGPSLSWAAGGGTSGDLTCASNPTTTTVATTTVPATTTTTVASGTVSTIWPSSTVPATVDSGDGQAVELGVKFTADTAGIVDGIRYYKAAANTGTHVGHLWSAAGGLLGSVTFGAGTASGWQEADFATPVAIAANTTYVASYWAPVGHYSDTSNGLASAVNSPPLHTLANSVSANGVYHYGSDIFPASSYHATNYWVDVAFVASGGPPPTTTTVPATTTTAPITTTTVPVTTTTVPSTTTTTVAPPPPGFPDATDTGVPAGTTLTPMSSSACNWVITTPGTVINGVDLAGCVDVEASNVTIENSRLSGNTWWGIRLGATNSAATNLKVLHDTIQATQGQGPDNGGYDYAVSDQDGGAVEVGWDNISGYKDGTDITTGSVHDSYYHDLSTFSGAHVQDIYVYPGAGLLIQHNTLINQAALQYTTAAIYIAPDAGHQHDVTVNDNLLAGGAFAFYGGDSTATNIVVTGNSFSTQIWPNCGYYGTDGYWWPNNAGNVWSGNVWADGPNAGHTIQP